MKRLIASLLVVFILSLAFFGCSEKESGADISSKGDSSDVSQAVSNESSEEVSNHEPKPEPKPEPEPDFFTKNGQDFLPTESKIPNCYIQTETENLYSIPLDFTQAENANVNISGEYIHIFYWDNGFRGRILSIEDGKTLLRMEFTDLESYGSLNNGCIWIANPNTLNVRIAHPDGRIFTVLDEKELAENNIVHQIKISDDGKYLLALLENSNYTIFNLETKERITANLKTADYYWEWHWIDGKFVLEGYEGNLVYINPENGESQKVYVDYNFYGIRNGFFYNETIDNITLFVQEENPEYYNMPVDNEALLSVGFGFAVTQIYSDINLLRFYDLRNNTLVSQAELPYDGFVSSADFTDKGTVLISMQMYDTDEGGFYLYLYDLPSVSATNKGEPFEAIITTQEALWQKIHNIAEKLEAETEIDILYGAEGNDFDNFSYMGKAEKDVFAVYSAMTTIQEVLSKYPKGMLKESYAETHKGLQLYLCGDILGMGYNSLDSAGGLTTESEGYIVVVLDINNNIKFDLPHELSHVFDRRIEYVSTFSEESYMATWEGFTPVTNGYVYSYEDYTDNYKYTLDYESKPENVWFLTGYSRTYPTEDRAQIMEHLFNYDNEFSSNILEYENLKSKAELYCRILRECFESCKTDEILQWEILLQN